MAWIRNRRKTILANATDLLVLDGKLKAYTFSSKVWILAVFENYDSALEELDRIHNWIAKGAEGVYQVGE